MAADCIAANWLACDGVVTDCMAASGMAAYWIAFSQMIKLFTTSKWLYDFNKNMQ